MNDMLWLILRCRPSQTMALEDALVALAVDAWTPKMTVLSRKAHTRRPKLTTMPVMPSFVFVRDREHNRLSGLKNALGDLAFGVFRWNGVVAHVTDSELEPLRNHSHSTIMETSVAQYVTGDIVRVIDGPFKGFDVRVISYDRTYYLVEVVDTSVKMKIPSLLLAANKPQSNLCVANSKSE